MAGVGLFERDTVEGAVEALADRDRTSMSISRVIMALATAFRAWAAVGR